MSVTNRKGIRFLVESTRRTKGIHKEISRAQAGLRRITSSNVPVQMLSCKESRNMTESVLSESSSSRYRRGKEKNKKKKQLILGRLMKKKKVLACR